MINGYKTPTHLNKQAAFSLQDALTLMLPFSTAADFTPNTPMQLSKDPQVNRAVWNALFSGGAMLGLGALIKHISAQRQNEKFNKKQQEAIESKLNGIVPFTEPDSSLKDTKKREERRTRELEKNANVLENAVTNATLGLIPIAAAAGGLYAGARAVNDSVKEDREEKLKKEIAELQNKLDKLYNDRIVLNEKRRELRKAAGLGDWIDSTGGFLNDVTDTVFGRENPDSPKQGMARTILSLPFLTAGAVGLLGTYTAKRYFDKRDADRAKLKMLEKKMLPADLVGTPPVIIMEEGPRGKLQVAGRKEEERPKDDEKEKDKDKEKEQDKEKTAENKTETKALPPADVMAALGLK